MVCASFSGCGHQGALAGIAVTTTAQHTPQATTPQRRLRTQRNQGLGDSVGRVGVVHDHQGASQIGLGIRQVKSHALHAPGYSRQLGTGLHRLHQVNTQGAQTANHAQQVVHVVLANQAGMKGLNGTALDHIKGQTLATGQSSGLQTGRTPTRASPDFDRAVLQLLG